MSIFKNSLELLSEACKSEKSDLQYDEVKSMFSNIYGGADKLDLELSFSPEMIPVIKSNFDDTCYVEAEDLARLAAHDETSITEAFDRVCSHYGLNKDSLNIVIESEDEMNKLITEAKKDSKKLGVLSKGMKQLKDLKDKHCKLCKK